MSWNDFAVHVRDYVILAGAALLTAAAAGIPLGVLASRGGALRSVILSLGNLGRVIPSLAILTFMLPLFGVGFFPAWIALSILASAPVAITTELSFAGVPNAALDAAVGIGMTRSQRFARVEWPMALPVVVSGLRTAATEVTASAVLASFIGAGGLGELIQTGLQANDARALWTGVAAVAAIALLADFAFAIGARRIEGRAWR